jgi:L-phenylalanine/L-methionine N-acetyltransferase
LSEIEIRATEPSDAEAISAIMNGPKVVANTLQLPWRPLSHQRERLEARPGVHQLVAVIDGQVVGQLNVHQNQSPRRRDVASFGMAVNESFHNRGVGSALMAAMLELADGWLGIRRIEMEVWTDNKSAIHLYEKVSSSKARAVSSPTEPARLSTRTTWRGYAD